MEHAGGLVVGSEEARAGARLASVEVTCWKVCSMEAQDCQPSSWAPSRWGNSGSHVGKCGAGIEGAVDETPGAPTQGQWATHAPGPGGDAVPVAVAFASQLLSSHSLCHFGHPWRQRWCPGSWPHMPTTTTKGWFRRSLTVNGSSLAVRRTAEDAFVPNLHLPHLLSVSPGDMKHSRLWVLTSMKAQERELRPNFLSRSRQGTGSWYLE